jgi:hypothetical protein
MQSDLHPDTRAGIHRAALRIIRKHPEWADIDLAKAVGVRDYEITAARQELIDLGELSAQTGGQLG